MKNISCWLASAAFCALPVSAMAQDADTASSSDNSYTGGLAEIIVTAEKRSVDLQDLSQAVTAFTADARQLAGIVTLQDFASFTPGLNYSVGNDRVFIRGIGRQTNTNGSDPGVSTYTDGIYDSATNSVAASDFFIERVEVLRGPQGTLYGRNSIGGAINAISKRPTADFSADTRVVIGNYDVFNLEAALSGSLTDGLRVRVAGSHAEQGKGYYKSAVGNPSEGGRGQRRYVELQLEADLGLESKAWLKVFTGSTDLYPRPLNRIGGYDFSPYPHNGIIPGAAFGYANFLSLDALDPNPAPAGATNHRRFSTDTVQRERMRDNFGIAGDITFALPSFDVKLLGGYQEYKIASRYDLDDTSVLSYEFPLNPMGLCAVGALGPACGPLTVRPALEFNFDNNKSFGSGELTLTSTHGGPLQWVAGLYYYQDTLAQANHFNARDQLELRAPSYLIPTTPLPTLVAAPVNPLGDFIYSASTMTTKSAAAYAQLDYQLTEGLILTGGIRYTRDKKRGSESFRAICYGCDPTGTVSPDQMGSSTPALDLTPAFVSYAPANGVISSTTVDPATGIARRDLKNKWDAVTGTAAIEWKPSEDQLAFFRYSRGYKSGGFNAGGITATPQTKAEYVNAYELGYKHSFDNRLRANLAFFYYDYRDLQVPVTVPLGAGGASITEFFNLRKSESYGAEAELIWQPVDALQLMLNYSYNESEIKSVTCFIDDSDPQGQQSDAVACGLPNAEGKQAQNLKGSSLPQMPRHKIAANAQYHIDAGSGTFTLSASYLWRDHSYSSIFNRRYNKMLAYDQVDARLIWTPKDNGYRVIAFARNLFDTKGYDNATGTHLLAPAPGSGNTAQNYGYTPPRTFGVQLDVSIR